MSTPFPSSYSMYNAGHVGSNHTTNPYATASSTPAAPSLTSPSSSSMLYSPYVIHPHEGSILVQPKHHQNNPYHTTPQSHIRSPYGMADSYLNAENQRIWRRDVRVERARTEGKRMYLIRSSPAHEFSDAARCRPFTPPEQWATLAPTTLYMKGSGTAIYQLTLSPDIDLMCTCPDYTFRHRRCKHIMWLLDRIFLSLPPYRLPESHEAHQTMSFIEIWRMFCDFRNRRVAAGTPIWPFVYDASLGSSRHALVTSSSLSFTSPLPPAVGTPSIIKPMMPMPASASTSLPDTQCTPPTPLGISNATSGGVLDNGWTPVAKPVSYDPVNASSSPPCSTPEHLPAKRAAAIVAQPIVTPAGIRCTRKPLPADGSELCCICLESMLPTACESLWCCEKQCGNWCHRECITEYFKAATSADNRACPYCRTPHTRKSSHYSPVIPCIVFLYA